MWEVIIVGAGPAGLSAALSLGRMRRNTLIIDAGEPRNATSPALHNFLSRDGTPPAELRAIAREQLRDYPTVQVMDAVLVLYVVAFIITAPVKVTIQNSRVTVTALDINIDTANRIDRIFNDCIVDMNAVLNVHSENITNKFSGLRDALLLRLISRVVIIHTIKIFVDFPLVAAITCHAVFDV